MASPSTAWKILRDLGPAWVLKRIKFQVQRRLGILRRRLPASDWEYESRDWLHPDAAFEVTDFKEYLKSGSRFFFVPNQLANVRHPGEVCRQADRVLAGEWLYFSRTWFKVGFPPDWHANVLDGNRVDDHAHWSDIDLESIHDVKFVWEPSRFSVVYLLVRAYAATRDERYAEGFWRLIEDWAERNSPNRGVNWASGQEVAVRVMAWCFGLYAFLDSASSANERVFRLIRMIEEHGKRIDGFIEYSLSQRNNHGIVEAASLFTIGILFPELRRGDEWLATGRDLIYKQLREQFYAGGSYIQHSFNYERVAIDALLWAFRLGELNGCRFPEESYKALGRAVDFMQGFCDPNTGGMPNYGGNDGAFLLPISPCDYSDFRPSLQAAHYLVTGGRFFPEGEWNEMFEWLFGSEMESRTSRPDTGSSDSALLPPGYVRLKARESWAMLRVERYVDRPSQADQLHLDFWWRGENVACDAGTYLYNGPKPWTNALAATGVHNTVTVAGRDQMTRAGRFLWVDWAQAEFAHYPVGEYGTAVVALHDGYKGIGAIHKRSVLTVGTLDCWIVVDDIDGDFSASARLHWLFPDYQFGWEQDKGRLSLQTQAGPFQCCIRVQEDSAVSLARAGELLEGASSGGEVGEQIRGWRSLYYGEKIPALSLTVESRVPNRFITLLAPPELVVDITETRAGLRSGERELVVTFGELGSERVFRNS